MSQYSEEIERRRTFAIISHPDAGKTTLTEKLLLFGGAIHVAGAVKSNKIKKTATSDWMEIEKQRGISVATSVMAFDYSGHKINILDTPGHQDFALKAQQPGDAFDDRRFARAVGPQQNSQLPIFHRKRYIVVGQHLAIFLGYVIDLQHSAKNPPCPPGVSRPGMGEL